MHPASLSDISSIKIMRRTALSGHPRRSKSLQKNKPPVWGGSSANATKSPSDLFQQLLVNIEIGVHVLHIVMLFERFHQADHSSCCLTFQLDIVLRDHGHAGRGRLDASLLDRF